MATSFGALCTDFYINQKIALKMDLPADRETVLHLFDRVRGELSDMSRFKRFSDELALESPRRDGAYRWLALRQNSIRSGTVNPETMDQGYELHELIMRLAPFFLSISALDVRGVELNFGFDLECKANHHAIVADALMPPGSPLGSLIDVPNAQPLDVQPIVGLNLDPRKGIRAYFEVKSRTTPGQVRADRYRTEPISVVLTLRQSGPIEQVEQLPTILADLRERGEWLAQEKLVPNLVSPISRAILGGV